MSEAAVCSLCSSPVLQLITEGGQPVEVDPEPTADGTIVPVRRGTAMRARILPGAQLPAQVPAWRKHATTCTQTPQARKRRAAARARQASGGPRCPVCSTPMDANLAREEPQHKTHPACDPAAHADQLRYLVRRDASHEIVPDIDPGSIALELGGGTVLDDEET